jgi:hypothetical protein
MMCTECHVMGDLLDRCQIDLVTVYPDIMKDHSSFIFRVKSPFGLTSKCYIPVYRISFLRINAAGDRSHLPGLSSAGSIRSGLFVAPITNNCEDF